MKTFKPGDLVKMSDGTQNYWWHRKPPGLIIAARTPYGRYAVLMNGKLHDIHEAWLVRIKEKR